MDNNDCSEVYWYLFIFVVKQVSELKVQHEEDLQKKEESHVEALARLDTQLTEKIAGKSQEVREAEVLTVWSKFLDLRIIKADFPQVLLVIALILISTTLSLETL